MSEDLLDSEAALKVLSLNHYRYLKYLNERGLLRRMVLGPRTFRYDKCECLALRDRAIAEGISLTSKP